MTKTLIRDIAFTKGEIFLNEVNKVDVLGRGNGVAVLSKTLYSHSASLPQVYKLVPTNLMLGWGGKPCDRQACHPGGSRNTLSRFLLQKPG